MRHDEEIIVSDELVLNYHLMHPGGDSDPGDPNLGYFLDDTYHLHYILRHPWSGPGPTSPRPGQSFSFIHVTSPDMLHWTWQSTKLQPSFTGHGTFSGTGFVTKEGQPAAIYAGLSEPRNSFITIAKDNRLSDWEVPYPVLPKNRQNGTNIGLLGDPDLFQTGDNYYAYSAGNNLELYKSTDLTNWIQVGPLISKDMQDVAIGEDVSCANFFPLGEKWMLLCISHYMGCRYYLGLWDPELEQFVPEIHRRMNWRRSHQSLTEPKYRDFFAPETLLSHDGRRVMWAWLATTDSAIALKSVQSLPRELSLGNDGDLRIKPLRELESLRYDHMPLENVSLTAKNTGEPGYLNTTNKITILEGDSLELRIEVDKDQADRRRFGFHLFAGKEDEDGLLVLIRPESETICIGDTEAPFAVSDLPETENLEIRIFVDKYLVELFINSRQAALHTFMNLKGSGNELRGYVFGDNPQTQPMKIRKIDVWKLKPTNQGFLEARNSRIWTPRIK